MILSNEQAFSVTVAENGDIIIKLKVNENINSSSSDIDSVAYHTPRNKRNN